MPFCPTFIDAFQWTIWTRIDDLPTPVLTCHRTHLKSKFYLFISQLFLENN